MKTQRTSKYQHYMAESCASSALEAINNGNTGRAIMMYEHALNFETDAINICCQDTNTSPYVLEYYRSAISYATECGRINKARHLLESALASELPADLAVEFEELLARL